METDQRGLRILLAEDNDLNHTPLRLMLNKDGHTVTVVEDGEEALQELARSRFDLILMDVQMPVMDGVAATRKIRGGAIAGATDIPIIALTAYAMPNDRERFMDAGMNDYLAKPVRWDDLRAVLARWGTRRGAGPAQAPPPERGTTP